MSDTPEKKKRGVRLAPEEAWEMVTKSHTGIYTTLKKDGTPIALPVWYVVLDNIIWMSTPERSKKVVRIGNNPRSSFLVESGELWRELKAVHLTGSSDMPEVSDELAKRIREAMDAKYGAFRTKTSAMPDSAKATYAKSVTIRFTPDERIVSWSNAQIMG
jgi:predicted pyridoxine 5'-phosphate oxidase superfamily flavin-nucleotide-binding protein